LFIKIHKVLVKEKNINYSKGKLINRYLKDFQNIIQKKGYFPNKERGAVKRKEIIKGNMLIWYFTA